MKKFKIFLIIFVMVIFLTPVHTARADAAPPMNSTRGGCQPGGGYSSPNGGGTGHF